MEHLIEQITSITSFLPSFLQGTGETLSIALVSLAAGLLIGLAFSLSYSIKSIWIRWPILLICNLIRGLPEILILFIVYFGGSYFLSYLTNGQIEINAFLAGTITLAIIFGAYASKIFYSALHHIVPGEKEAAAILGLSRWKTLYFIILPQIWHQSLPGLGNLWLTLLKDTVLVSLIGGTDLMSRTQIIVQNTQQPFTFYLLMAGIYLFLTTLSEFGIQSIQRTKHV